MAEEVKYKVADDLKIKVTLYSGKEVTLDIMKISMREWKDVTSLGKTADDEAVIIAKVTGLKAEELTDMAQPDYRLIVDAFIRAGTQPLTNPT
jgi:SepF-like predicted cell division protein (DUF552 family)